MKGIYFTFFILLLIVASCVDDTLYEIEGKFSNTNGQVLYFSRMTTNGLAPIDSTVLDETGNFTFRGVTEITDFFLLHTTTNNAIILLIAPGDQIELSGDVKDLPRTYTVDGSEDSKLAGELTAKLNNSIDKIQNLGRIYQDSIRSPSILRIKAGLDMQYQQIVQEQRRYSMFFVEKNPRSLASLMALYQQINRGTPVFNIMDDLKYFEMIDSSLMAIYPRSEAVKALDAQIREVKRQIKEISRAEMVTGIGALAPEIALPTPDGDTILLSSLRGKIVLLDFWASWCSPCRIENPNLVANYKKYTEKGFEVYQVSLDQNKEVWMEAIERDSLTWTHVSDLQYWSSAAARLYNINSIPANFLLDRNGRIIAKNLKGRQLGEELSKIFK